jgi:Ribonuclease G/E
MKGQGGMMLRLPAGGSAFLRQGRGLSPGEPVLVQVTGTAEPGKAVPVTDRVLFKSRHAIVTPDAPGLNVARSITDAEERARLLAIAHEVMEGPFGLILRSAADGAPADEVAADIAATLDLATAVTDDMNGREAECLTEGDGPHRVAWREWRAGTVVSEPGGFVREGVLDQIEALRSPVVELGAGTMVVEPTRALVAVDVNTGGDTSAAAGLKANLAAARALPRALRLRGLGGQVTVDFAPMSKAHRGQLEQTLQAGFRNDPVETSLLGWTPAGNFELSRKRERAPVLRLIDP